MANVTYNELFMFSIWIYQIRTKRTVEVVAEVVEQHKIPKRPRTEEDEREDVIKNKVWGAERTGNHFLESKKAESTRKYERSSWYAQQWPNLIIYKPKAKCLNPGVTIRIAVQL